MKTISVNVGTPKLKRIPLGEEPEVVPYPVFVSVELTDDEKMALQGGVASAAMCNVLLQAVGADEACKAIEGATDLGGEPLLYPEKVSALCKVVRAIDNAMRQHEAHP